ncbi:XdhC family protein [Rudaea sp.]|uniref:XdhC family protein n=1 Tax=Rudaea sp. TaxID=2136325 RepID=UPI002ECFC906
MPGLLDVLAALHARGESGVLGIVFATLGSTYQKPGALVLLDAAGLRYGVISGGCLEPELEARAQTVHTRGLADTIDFDTRSDEDLTFGTGTGCRGRIHLVLLPQSPSAPFTQALRKLRASTSTLALSLTIEGDGIGSGNASLDGESWDWGRDGDPAAPHAFDERSVVRLRIAPPARVLLFGCGPESIPLHEFIRRLGWRSTVIEHRGRWLKFAQRAGAEEVLESGPDTAAPVWRQQHFDAAIAMCHNYALDMKHLAYCAASDLSYIGLLGPAARRDQMLQEIGADAAERLKLRLHAPVGLPLGGSGPDVLALSIAAELQQHFARVRGTR